jgi:hypothetical protein
MAAVVVAPTQCTGTLRPKAWGEGRAHELHYSRAEGALVRRSEFAWWECALIVLALWLEALVGRRNA